jgi:outer membrane protein
MDHFAAFRMRTAQLLQTVRGVVVLSLTLATVQAQPTATFTLESALRRAHEANLSLLLSREQLESSVQAQRRARANLLPNLSGEATQARSRNFFGGGTAGDAIGGGGEGGDGRVFSTSNSFQALLRARLALFDVNDHADYRVARFNTEIARLQLDQAAEDVREAIARLYLTHLRNLRQSDAIRAQIERDLVLFDLASRRAEAGTATSLDVTRAEVRLAASELRLAQQETAIFESALQFKQGLDLAYDGEIQLAPVEMDPADTALYSAFELEEILARRPEVVVERRSLARNELARRAANYEWLPSVSLSGYYGQAGLTFDDDLDEVWALQLGISVPIFEGFRIDANQREAASAVRAQRIALTQTEKQVEADYRLALTQVRTAARSVEIAGKQKTLAERELDLARRRFTEGVADNSEVVDAQANLAEAEDGLVEAEYRYHLARLALARARGDVLGLTRP